MLVSRTAPGAANEGPAAVGCVPPVLAIGRQVTGPPCIPLLGVLEWHAVSPFLEACLEKTLGIAEDEWCVGPGADLIELKDAACIGEDLEIPVSAANSAIGWCSIKCWETNSSGIF